MQFLLRKYALDKNGDAQLTDVELDAESLSLGSAPDADIQLLGEKILAHHANIEQQAQGLTIKAARGCSFSHNGAEVKHAELAVGDQLLIGTHQLEVIAPPPGFDLALQWRAAEVDGSLLANAYKTRLNQLGLRPRQLSWLLALLVLVCAGLIPLADYFWRSSHSTSDRSEFVNDQGTHQFTAESFWNSGPLHSAHRVAIGDQCESCHKKPFEQVTDQACVACHSEPADHVNPHHSNSQLFAGLACQSCHKEHNEPGQLVNRNESLCTSCHTRLEPAVEGFSAATHPQFKLSLLRPEVVRSIGSLSQSWVLERKSVALDNRENSHLKFSHKAHLDATKVRDMGTNEALQCSQCHQLSADKEHFVPITMEANCSSCHELTFDPAQPKKQLPHGEIAAIYPALEAHFLGLAFDKNQTEATVPLRRLPAKTLKANSCQGDFACAQQQATDEADRQFSQKGCVTCHEIEQIQGADVRSRWQLMPVKLASDWYPGARFNHQSHLTQRGSSGNQLCTSCHNADASDKSEDILIPGIENCTQCHGDSHFKDKVVLECVACHAFHPSPLQQQFQRLTDEALEHSLTTANTENSAAAAENPSVDNSAAEGATP